MKYRETIYYKQWDTVHATDGFAGKKKKCKDQVLPQVVHCFMNMRTYFEGLYMEEVLDNFMPTHGKSQQFNLTLLH